MTCSPEIIKQIAEYTGEKHAEEWYRAIFAPPDTTKMINKIFHRVKNEELYHLIKTCSWKREDAQSTYTIFSEYFAKILKIPPEYYPKIILKDVNDYDGTNRAHLVCDIESFKISKLEIYFDTTVDLDSSVYVRVGHVAHEIIHTYQHVTGCTWCRKHLWWFKCGWKSKRMHLFFVLCRPFKPKPLLYWLNWLVAVHDTKNILYEKQLVESEAYDVGIHTQDVILRTWRRLNEDGLFTR